MNRLFIALLMITSAALAHDPGISNATLELRAAPVIIRLTFAPGDLLVAGMAGTDEGSLKEVALRACEWRSEMGPAHLRLRSAKLLDKTTAEFVFEAPRVPGTFRSLLLPDMPLGHRQLLVLRDHKGDSLRIQMLSARSGKETVSQADLDKTAPPARVAASRAPAHPVRLLFCGLLILGTAAFPSAARWAR